MGAAAIMRNCPTLQSDCEILHNGLERLAPFRGAGARRHLVGGSAHAWRRSCHRRETGRCTGKGNRTQAGGSARAQLYPDAGRPAHCRGRLRHGGSRLLGRARSAGSRVTNSRRSRDQRTAGARQRAGGAETGESEARASRYLHQIDRGKAQRLTEPARSRSRAAPVAADGTRALCPKSRPFPFQPLRHTFVPQGDAVTRILLYRV